MVTGFVTRTLVLVRQFVCGLHGHDALLHFEPDRLSMRCITCGHQTPGWDIRPSPVHCATERKARVFRVPLVGARRVA